MDVKGELMTDLGGPFTILLPENEALQAFLDVGSPSAPTTLVGHIIFGVIEFSDLVEIGGGVWRNKPNNNNKSTVTKRICAHCS